jgi:hypothetical protein
LIADQKLTLEVPPSSIDDHLEELRYSGRWSETAIPISKEGHYGGEQFTKNEQLLTMAIARAASAGDEPYILVMDANISVDDSTAISTALRLSHLVHLTNDRNPEEAGAPTFQFGGIADPIVKGTKGSSAIDMALANQAASLIISEARLAWGIVEGLDHVPLILILNASAVHFSRREAKQTQRLDLSLLTKLNDVDCNRLYRTVRQICREHGVILCLDDVNVAHSSW